MQKKKKKADRHVRITLEVWEQLRRLAFRAHKPMSEIVEELVMHHRRKTPVK